MKTEQTIPVKDVIATVNEVANDAAETFATPAENKQARVARWLGFAGVILKAVIGLFGRKN